MAITIASTVKSYTVISNDDILKSKLSLEAIGLYCILSILDEKFDIIPIDLKNDEIYEMIRSINKVTILSKEKYNLCLEELYNNNLLEHE